MKIKALLAIIATIFAFAISPAQADEDDGIKRLAIQVSDNFDGTMTKALNVAANFARMQSEAGNLYEIEIVTFNAGLHMLREDTSPVLERLKSFSESIPDVRFSACGNTIAGMTRQSGGTPPPILEFAEVVPGGVERLMQLDAEGWFVIRP
ncbi:MAG: hypothetical protein QGI08_09040 [Paracoccaceae bacterium]|jgi:hypothetical protein|nr:hypothetical protein [Paracoccaceae bacterium]MDP7185849.1 hypothetical protein [Paracoccaceae bacterium]